MRHQRPLPLLKIAVSLALLSAVWVAVPTAAADRVVVVQSGDTLSGIALGNRVSMAELLALNDIKDPNRIFAGQRLHLPGVAPVSPPPPSAVPSAAGVHVVLAGEHLTGIARKYGTTIAAIVAVNQVANPSYLRVGQRLAIPGVTGASPPGSPTSNATAVSTTAGMSPGMAALVTARASIGSIVASEAAAQGVAVAFALAVAWQESGWRADAVSRSGAVGVMQLMPATADWVARTIVGQPVDPRDALSNAHAGIALLKHYLARYGGDRALALAAYFQGQAAADRHGIYAVTRPYIASVTALESIFTR